MTNPQSPFSILETAAIEMHELAKTWQDAGFSRAEAMQMLCVVLASSIQQGKQS